MSTLAPQLTVDPADYSDPLDAADVLLLLDAYARDPMGGGTALAEDGTLVANGGRVLNVTARAPSVTEAQQAAYRAVDALDFPTGFCRRDIGWREVTREATAA